MILKTMHKVAFEFIIITINVFFAWEKSTLLNEIT